MSIVRSIVTTLDGTIEIWSELGQGTEVKICIPMMRVPRADSVSTTTSSTTEAHHDDPIEAFRNDYPGKTAGLFGLDQESETVRVLTCYLSEWLGFKIISTSRPVDVIVADEGAFPRLLESKSVLSSVIVLCNTPRSHPKGSNANGNTAVQFISKPFGPLKLAKVLRFCMEKASQPPTAHGPLNMGPADDSDVDVPQGGASQSGPEPAEVKQKQATPPPAPPPPALVQDRRPPRLLLVDDNLINLRLLQTFMRKREQKLIDSAQNGLLAVQAAERNADGYDIIFMGTLQLPIYFAISIF